MKDAIAAHREAARKLREEAALLSTKAGGNMPSRVRQLVEWAEENEAYAERLTREESP